jgi:hypothetical protein
MGRMQPLGFAVLMLLAVVVFAVTAQAAARIATIEVKGMV